MEKLTYSSSIKRIDASSQKEFEMMREAIRGEFEAGKYVRDMGVGALSGAAAGAIAGGGVGSVPAAAVGAISGAAYGLGSNAVSDIWYQTRSNEDKASWQAGDLQERLQKIGEMLGGKLQSPQLSEELNKLGSQYKNYIDVVVQKNNSDDHNKQYEQNMFNPATDVYKNFKNQFVQKTARNKMVRLVESSDSSPAAMIGGLAGAAATDNFIRNQNKAVPNIAPVSRIPITQDMVLSYLKDKNSVSPPIQKQVESYLTYNQDMKNWYDGYLKLTDVEKDLWHKNAPINQNVLFNGVDDAANQAVNQISKSSFWKSVGNGAKGLGAGLVVDWASNWGLDKIELMLNGGEINMFRTQLSDIGKTITEVNRLSRNQEDVVFAGSMLWTQLKQIDRAFENAEKKVKESPKSESIPSGQVQIQASTNSKFKRVV